MMSLPTAREINPIAEDLDGQRAETHFLGRSVEEAEAMFRENPFCYQEDMMWMGPVAFRFYLPAAIRYAHADKDEAFVAHFVGTLEFRLRHEAKELEPVAAALAEFCNDLIEQWEEFEDISQSYGNVCGKLATLRVAFVRMGMG